MIGLDATDADFILKLAELGHLPNLARLLEEGQFVRLSSPANIYAGGVWPTFYTGQSVPWHGLFHSKLWRPDTMQVEAPTRKWIAANPFWEHFANSAIRVCVVDAPMVLDASAPVNGVAINGWATHDLIHTGSWPPSLWEELANQHGPPLMAPEKFGLQSERNLAELAPMLIEATRQQCELATSLLQEHTWQFGCVVFGAAHRIGHYLWSDQQYEEHEGPMGSQSEVPPALIDVYASVDAAFGELVAEIPSDTTVAAFAVHGMGANAGWSDLFPEILDGIHGQSGDTVPKGLLYRLKRRVPHHWVRPILANLPRAVTQWATKLWSANMYDWQRTQFFPMPMDAVGYVRINLVGRERLGTVKPEEYDALCDELAALIGGLVDADSGEPISQTIHHPYRDAVSSAPARHLLPDLAVEFDGPPARACRRLVSTTIPGFEFAVPEKLPSGRSGNHTKSAWLLVRGPGISPGRATTTHSVLDLLPTILQWLGEPQAPYAEGKPIDFGRYK